MLPDKHPGVPQQSGHSEKGTPHLRPETGGGTGTRVLASPGRALEETHHSLLEKGGGDKCHERPARYRHRGGEPGCNWHWEDSRYCLNRGRN